MLFVAVVVAVAAVVVATAGIAGKPVVTASADLIQLLLLLPGAFSGIAYENLSRLRTTKHDRHQRQQEEQYITG